MNAQLMVEQPTDLLTANLRALAAHDFALAEQLGLQQQPAGLRGWQYFIEPARSGDLTLQARSATAQLWLHSKYDPQAEARDLVAAAEVARRGNAIVFGLGLGYVAEAALAALPSDGQLLIIEPDFLCARLALMDRPLAALLGDPRVTLLVRPTQEQAFSTWATRFSLVHASGIAFVSSPNVDRRLPEGFAAQLMDQIRGYMHTVAGNLQTLMVMAHVYLSNTLQSVPHLVRSPGVNTLFDRFGDVPVVCVAAGPSLEQTLPTLRQVQDRCLIIACDTALRPLINAGITPHLICAGDPQEANHRHIAGLTSQVPSYLCAEPMTYPASLAEYGDRLFIASFRDRLMNWIEQELGEMGQVLCWGSVATMVFDLARRVGGNPIIFLGQDLSFPGGRTYVPGTYFETELGHDMTAEAQAARLNDNRLMTLTDIYGQPVQTNRQMFAYHRWFVREIAQTSPDITVINATGGGILKEGVQIRDFSDVASEYCTHPLDIWERLAAARQEPQTRDLPRFMASLDQLQADFESLDREARQAFNDLTEWYRTMHSLGRLPEGLAAERLHAADAMRKRLFQHGFATTLLEMANQTGIKSFLNAQAALGGKQANFNVYMEALEAYLKLYASVVQAMMRLRPALQSAVRQARQVMVESSVVGAKET